MSGAGQRAHLSFCRGAHDVRLYYEWWVPPAARAMLVLVHGIGEHSGRYGPFIRYFVERGYGVAVYDQRGHGQSEGLRGHIEHFQDLLSDLAQVLQHTKSAYPDLPYFLVGHSFGGQVALNFVVRYAKGIRGLIASSPNIALKMRIPHWKRWLSRYVQHWAPKLLLRQTFPAKWLSHDAAIVEAYLRDPRVVRHVTLHTATELLQNLDVVMALAARIHVPSLFLHAGDDQICDPEATRLFFRRIPVLRKRLKVYAGMYHELFNEVDKAAVFHDMEQWLHEVLQEDRLGLGRSPDVADRSTPVPETLEPIIRGERWVGHP